MACKWVEAHFLRLDAQVCGAVLTMGQHEQCPSSLGVAGTRRACHRWPGGLVTLNPCTDMRVQHQWRVCCSTHTRAASLDAAAAASHSLAVTRATSEASACHDTPSSNIMRLAARCRVAQPETSLYPVARQALC